MGRVWQNRLRRRRSVAECTVRPDAVLVAAPARDHHRNFREAAEDFAVEQLVSEFCFDTAMRW